MTYHHSLIDEVQVLPHLSGVTTARRSGGVSGFATHQEDDANDGVFRPGRIELTTRLEV